MNLIIVCIDSLRRDHVGCYGNPWIRTPNFDTFGEKAFLFNGFNLNGIPTIPFRRALMLGREVFPYKDALAPARNVVSVLGWQPFTNEETTLQEILQDAGYVTGLITDAYHYFRPGMNHYRGFHSWEFIRGQEGDPYRTGVTDRIAEPYLYPPIQGTRMQNFLEQYLRNIEDRRFEEDYFAAKVFRAAEKWLERNACYYKNYFLLIDCFDPHEPWDPPREYVDLYDPNYSGKEIIFPQAGTTDTISPAELKHIRALYAGEVSFVDRWFGKFMEKFYHLGLEKDTAVLFLSDHGHPLGEHQIIRKIPKALYPELIDAPLMLYLPKAHGKKSIEAIIQECDIAPTLLELMGVKAAESMKGLDFSAVLNNEKMEMRKYAAGGYHTHAYTRNRKFHYFVNLREPKERYLFNLEKDRDMNQNIAETNPADLAVMEDLLKKSMDGWQLPEKMGGHSYTMPYIPFALKS